MKCDICDANESIPFRCNYCDKLFCQMHTIPVNHSCVSVNEYINEKTLKIILQWIRI
ncbi:MAG: hypothetical protein E6K94_03935 [Thaumarchaeota archaeon]|nr:MAG: hypothetical protein E6L01_03760 [Nitrososphaerota archaeon]TLX91183.1 MAG: hypothetical protein E6K94_03935 [Nitrososphaerota archaeon]